MSQGSGYKAHESVSAKSNESSFSKLVDEGYEILCGLSPSQRYPPGLELLQQGSLAQYIYFIEDGLVKLTSPCENGRELIVCLRSHGQLIGITSVILQKSYSLQATTLTYCHMRRISSEELLDSLTTNIQFCCYVQQAQSREIDEQVIPIVELGGYSARNRLERFLWMLIQEKISLDSQESIRIRIPLKHWELAQLLAITPAYLSRLLNQLESEGILQRRNGQLVMLDAGRLWHSSITSDVLDLTSAKKQR